eukprot:CAMPEP_0117424632 /NCGR_PEP_ID=MMETSP0758-20121206/5014_1 /TAXON_ID=63605 /ORGANISM="Percolomonas cosmopolitus, Strain AE-1 (ATCC 50343)" /LENGTH=1148 /DNA_ID=CAMNT_0005208531 /DNA_START=395 /DNA_END=3841 /DNA_ORIENTATION=+
MEEKEGFKIINAYEKRKWRITGMKCGKCKKKVEEELKKVEGVESVKVNLDQKIATITSEDRDNLKTEIKQKLNELGFEGKENLETELVVSMSCGKCKKKIEDILSNIRGIEEFKIDLEQKRVTIEHRNEDVIEDVIETLREANRTVEIRMEDQREEETAPQSAIESKQQQIRIEGMTCGNCTSKVTRELNQIKGISQVHVSLEDKLATFVAENDIVVEEAKQKIRHCGFQLGDNINRQREIGKVDDDEEDDIMKNEKITLKPTNDDQFQFSTVKLAIGGMSCASCVNKVETEALALEGVKAAAVNLIAEEGEFEYNPALIKPEDIADAITDAGHKSTIIEVISADDQKKTDVATITLKLLDSKPSLPLHLKEELSNLEGLMQIEEFEKYHVVKIKYESTQLGARTIYHFLEDNGIRVTPYNDFEFEKNSNSANSNIKIWRNRCLTAFAMAIPAMVIKLVESFLDTSIFTHLIFNFLLFIMVTPVQFWAGLHFHTSALRALKHFSADMNVLISLATTVAYFSSTFMFIYSVALFKPVHVSFETAAMVIAFQSLGKYLESLAKAKTSQSVSSLLNLQAKMAHLVENDSENVEDIDCQLIEINDTLRIFPGETIPTDGVIAFGDTSVDESMLTGENTLIYKTKGDTVFGGTINTEGTIHLRATSVGGNSMLHQIISMVKSAQTKKAPIQRLADKISTIFVPIVVIIAIITLLIWLCLTYFNIVAVPESQNVILFCLKFPLSVLVIACPCALGLATPTAVLVGTGVGARMGILIKGGEALEATHKVDVMVFDKTGTLTVGKPSVVKFGVFDNAVDQDTFWKFVAVTEGDSEHAIGKSLYAHAASSIKKDSFHVKRISSEVTAGKGIKAALSFNNNDVTVFIGSEKYLLESFEMNALIDAHRMLIRKYQKQGCTIVVVGQQRGSTQKIIGFIAMRDAIREEARNVIRFLNSKRIHTMILSGDNRYAVRHVQKELNCSSFYSGVLPSDKLKVIEELQSHGDVVAMVGDGINDSPAIAKANVGMAVGVGTDIAIQTADIVLVRTDLREVVTAIDLSKKTYKRILWNHFWALGYNFFFVPLAMGILYPFLHITIPPMLAAITMMGSSLLVIGSSLFLNYYKRPSFFKTVERRSNLIESIADSDSDEDFILIDHPYE